MKKIEAIIRLFRLDVVLSRLKEIGVVGMTVVEVRGCGNQKSHVEIYRGREITTDFFPRIKLEIVVPEHLAGSVVDVILESAKTGNVGDGKIFVTSIDQAVRIRTEEKGESAIT